MLTADPDFLPVELTGPTYPFFVLLGTSTMVEELAVTTFYIRIGLILFAGLFAVSGRILANNLIMS